jgi:hypothetical protein
MSTRYNNGSHYENYQRAAELHDADAHAHRAAEQHGHQDHLTGHEHSTLALEHSQGADRNTQAGTNGHGISAFGHDDIAPLAYALWQARGCPDGSSQDDWFHAPTNCDRAPADDVPARSAEGTSKRFWRNSWLTKLLIRTTVTE